MKNSTLFKSFTDTIKMFLVTIFLAAIGISLVFGIGTLAVYLASINPLLAFIPFFVIIFAVFWMLNYMAQKEEETYKKNNRTIL